MFKTYISSPLPDLVPENTDHRINTHVSFSLEEIIKDFKKNTQRLKNKRIQNHARSQKIFKFSLLGTAIIFTALIAIYLISYYFKS